MGFYAELSERTRDEREELLGIPVLVRAVRGEIRLETYVAFLTQAYQHVRHTVPLLMAMGAGLPERSAWLREPIAHYVSEELGHEAWVLDDLAACGADEKQLRTGEPALPCEVMVAYAYDVVHRRNPIGLLGMVYVLEGTSIQLASRAARVIQAQLGLPRHAFRYLTSHGELDREHVGFFESLVDRFDELIDREWLVHCARVFYRLYGDIFRQLPTFDTQGSTCPS